MLGSAVHVQGQYDEHGQNRQANWYFFRIEGVQDRDITLTLTDFVGEYNGKPGACADGGRTRSRSSSEDGEHWRPYHRGDLGRPRKEATLRLSPATRRDLDRPQPPYTHSRLLRLLEQVGRMRPVARVEVIGKTAMGRDLHMITVTNCGRVDDRRRSRSGSRPVSMPGNPGRRTSWKARSRSSPRRTPWPTTPRQVVFVFTPMVDPDGCATGKVRFNANGYDVNRHWDEVDLRSKRYLERMPEIWYVKKAILGYVSSGRAIDLMLNLHNTETTEYLETQASDEPSRRRMSRLFDLLIAETSFDPTAHGTVLRTDWIIRQIRVSPGRISRSF